MTLKLKLFIVIIFLLAPTGLYAYQKEPLKEKVVVVSQENEISEIEEMPTIEEADTEAMEIEHCHEKEHREEIVQEASRGYSHGHEFIVTAYDLSVESCGKAPNHPGYGVTASGKNLAGHTLESARAIAVDPNVIPLWSQVHIAFDDENMKQYDGIYTAVDTGGAIKGNRIDLYVGEDEHELAYSIGVRSARVTYME